MYRTPRTLFVALLTLTYPTYVLAAGTPPLLVVNHNHYVNFATFYQIGASGTLTSPRQVVTGGMGGQTAGVAVFHSATEGCFFVADAGSNDIAAIDLGLNVVGNFHGGPSDMGDRGLFLAVNQGYLYAGFGGQIDTQGKSRLASFQILSGCKLKFLASVPAVGLGHFGGPGIPSALAAHGNILVVAYGDGSIESFHFSHGVAKSNGDLQDSSAAAKGHLPTSVDISADSRFAIFGDVPASNERDLTTLEVADVSSGKLSRPTTVYHLPGNVLSASVRLSPDESLLYLSGGVGDDATFTTLGAALFDKTTGVLTHGCSQSLNDPGQEWWSPFNVAFAQNATGNGASLYVIENSFPSAGAGQYLASVSVKSNGRTCSFTESPASPLEQEEPVTDQGSVASWPPRSF
jgi:hypothetical protein